MRSPTLGFDLLASPRSRNQRKYAREGCRPPIRLARPASEKLRHTSPEQSYDDSPVVLNRHGLPTWASANETTAAASVVAAATGIRLVTVRHTAVAMAITSARALGIWILCDDGADRGIRRSPPGWGLARLTRLPDTVWPTVYRRVQPWQPTRSGPNPPSFVACARPMAGQHPLSR